MLGRQMKHRPARVVSAALLIVAGAAAASYGSTLISLKIDASDLVPTADIAGLFTNDPGNASDVDIDYVPLVVPAAVFQNVGDVQFINIGSLNVMAGEAILENVDVVAPGGVFSYPASLSAALQTAAVGDYFGLTTANFSTENGYVAGVTGLVGLGFPFFGQAQLDAGTKSVTYTAPNGVMATFDFAFERSDGTMGSTVGDGMQPTNDDVVLKATLVSYMIPEPGTIALFGFSVLAVALLRRKR